MLSRNRLYYGTEQPPLEQRKLRAGLLSLLFEEGDLRYIRLGEREVIRRVYVAVRDRNWGTLPGTLSNLHLNAQSDSFHISYEMQHKQGEIAYTWKGIIVGDKAGTITFQMEGEALSTFWRNRIGFCVLHPIRECMGVPSRIEHVNGTVEESVFPLHIAPQYIINGQVQPHEPFSEMRAVSHQLFPGLWAEVRFSGDTFEMEDQRNWIDASYKTYCTPARLPFPVEVPQGTRISQSTVLSLHGVVPELSPIAHTDTVNFSIESSSPVPLPPVGLGVATHREMLTARQIERLKALNLSHLRVDLRLSGQDYPAILRKATDEARALGISLEIALTLSDEAASELQTLMRLLTEVQPPVYAWLIFHINEPSTGEQWIRLARKHLSAYSPGAKFGGGTNAYFAQLNREHIPVELLDFVCFSANPQVHAFDNASLAETCEMLASTIETGFQIAKSRPMAVTPITLKPRFLPDATGPEIPLLSDELPSTVDPRQMSLFGAGWTLASFKYLAESRHLAYVTYYETMGWRGVMETDSGSPMQNKFSSVPGGVFPMYHVLADIGEFAGGEVLPSRSTSTLHVDGLVLRKDKKTRVTLANLGAEPQQVNLPALNAQATLWMMDETNAEEAMSTPEAFRARVGKPLIDSGGVHQLSLHPFAIARIDMVLD